MASAKEIEIKFRVDDVRTLNQALRRAGFRLVTPRTHEMNTLYDLPGGQLRQRGELLRLRKYGREWTLTHKAKGQAGKHKIRVETETNVVDGTKIEIIFRAIGLGSCFRYEKFRAEWTDGRGYVVVDETPIGNYAEIEGTARWIDQIARQLRIPTSDYITDTYAALFSQWKQSSRSPAREMTFAAIGRRKRR